MTFDRSALKEAKRIVVSGGTRTMSCAHGNRNLDRLVRVARERAD